MTMAHEMDTAAELERWPVPGDNLVRYNVPERDGIELWAGLHGGTRPETDPYHYAYSVPTPASFDDDNENWVKESLEGSLKDYLKSIAYSLVDELGKDVITEFSFQYHGEPWGLTTPIDRTIYLYLENVDFVTPQFIRAVQTCLIQEFPQWRLRLYNLTDHGPTDLVIYPDAIRVGDDLARRDEELDVAVPRWTIQAEAIRDKTIGASRRQLRYMKALIPDLLHKLDQTPVVFVAAFDNRQGNTQKHGIWVLQPHRRQFAHNSKAAGDDYHVGPHGVVPYPRDNRDYIAQLTQCVNPPAGEHELRFRETVWDKAQFKPVVIPGAPVLTIRVTETDILTDDQLKQLLATKAAGGK